MCSVMNFEDRDPKIQAHVQNGEFHHALEELVHGYQRVLAYYCRTMLGSISDADAEEAVSDIFLAAYRAMPRFRHGAPVRNWLFGIARKHCYKVLRDHYRRTRLVEEHRAYIALQAHRHPLEALEEGAQTKEALNLLLYCLTKLRRRDRELLTMRYIEGFSIAEMARHYNRGDTTIRGWLSTSRGRLLAAYIRASGRHIEDEW